MKVRNIWNFVGLALLLALSGCSGPLVSASGRLTYKGQPVPSTYVHFRTDEGVYRGKHTVILKYYVGVDEELRKIPPKASKELKAVIAKYGDLKTSPLHYEISKNGQFFDIQLE